MLASYEIKAAFGGGKSETVVSENGDYWGKVANSTSGYAEEHTFVIYHQILLLIVQNKYTPPITH